MKTPKRHISRSYNYNKPNDNTFISQSNNIVFNSLSDDQIKISELPEASGLESYDLIPIVDISGASLTTKKVTLSNFIESTFNTSILPSGDNIQFSNIGNSLYINTSPTGSFSQINIQPSYFVDKGDCQNSIFVLHGVTSGNPAGETELSIDGVSFGLSVPSGTLLSGTANILGSKNDGTVVARYYRQFTIKNISGATSIVGTISSLGSDETSGTSINISANNTNDYLSIKTSGVNNEVWRWTASINAINMAYGS